MDLGNGTIVENFEALASWAVHCAAESFETLLSLFVSRDWSRAWPQSAKQAAVEEADWSPGTSECCELGAAAAGLIVLHAI